MAHVNHDTTAYAQGCEQQVLRINRCADCATWIHPPKRICPNCWSESVEPTEVGGGGHLVSFSVPRVAPGDSDPVITAVVAMDQADGVRILARLVGVGEVTIGAALDIDWSRIGGATAPVFRLTEGRT